MSDFSAFYENPLASDIQSSSLHNSSNDTTTCIPEVNIFRANTFPSHSNFQDHVATLTLMDLENETMVVDSVPLIETLINCKRIPNPSFYPINSRSSALDVFQTLVERELKFIENNRVFQPYSNLTTQDRSAIKSLKNNSHIVIYSADKGCSMVILDSSIYVKEINDMLTDSNI